MKNSLSILFFLISIVLYGQNVIILDNNKLGQSFTKSTYIYEDKENKLTIDAVLKHDIPFHPFDKKTERINFTSSTYWLKFKVKNLSDYERLVFFIARTITDEVVLYEIENDKVVNMQVTGDAVPLKDKTIKTIENLFPVRIPKKQTKEFIVRLESDGEVITLPLIIDTNKGFYISTKARVFFLGAFYGVLLVIAIIYFLYYFGMRDKSLLLYSIYVLSVFMLQFTLDGLSYFYIFKHIQFLEPYTVVVFAALAPISFLIYVRTFLKLKENHPFINQLFNVSIALLVMVIVMTFIPGKPHEISYPLINAVSLIAVLVVLGTILYLRKIGEAVCVQFALAIYIIIAGAIVFILTNFGIINNPFLFKYALKIAAFIEILLLAISMSNKLSGLQKEKEKAQAEALKSLSEKNRLIDQQKEMLEQQVKERTQKLEVQKEQLSEKNKEIIDSINYAKRLQNALIPPIESIKEITEDSFVFYKPKDIVSGDFYWIDERTTTHKDKPNEKVLIIAVADCTGHGVPGAFISIIGLNIFNQALKEKSINTPAHTLDYLNTQVYNTVNKHKNNENIIRDGMDIAMCSYNKETLVLNFSGAKNPIYIVRNFELFELKGDKQPIGYAEHAKPFQLQEFQLEKGDMIYASTDGFADQFGGERGKKFKYKAFKDLLIKVSHESCKKQKEIIESVFNQWKGDLEQLDDICIAGVRV